MRKVAGKPRPACGAGAAEGTEPATLTQLAPQIAPVISAQVREQQAA